jgi:hypothetical protein
MTISIEQMKTLCDESTSLGEWRAASHVFVPEAIRVMEMMAEALQISAGYIALVADGASKMPILKSRAQSDCEIISNALNAFDALATPRINK